jgi:hypothetical protein
MGRMDQCWRKVGDFGTQLGLALGRSLENGKTFSSKITSQEIYVPPVDKSRHLNPLCLLL